MAARLPEEYDFYPPSWNLPEQLPDLLDALKRNRTKVIRHLLLLSKTTLVVSA